MPLKFLPHRGSSLSRALSEHSQVPREIRSFPFSEFFFFKTRLASKHEKSTTVQKHTAQLRTWKHFQNQTDLWGGFFLFFCFKGKLTQQIFPLLAFQPHIPAEVRTHLARCSATARKITALLNNGRGGTGPSTEHFWNTYMADDLCETWILHTSQVFLQCSFRTASTGKQIQCPAAHKT